jgi:hypothetical protein
MWNLYQYVSSAWFQNETGGSWCEDKEVTFMKNYLSPKAGR